MKFQNHFLERTNAQTSTHECTCIVQGNVNMRCASLKTLRLTESEKIKVIVDNFVYYKIWR